MSTELTPEQIQDKYDCWEAQKKLVEITNSSDYPGSKKYRLMLLQNQTLIDILKHVELLNEMFNKYERRNRI